MKLVIKGVLQDAYPSRDNRSYIVIIRDNEAHKVEKNVSQSPVNIHPGSSGIFTLQGYRPSVSCGFCRSVEFEAAPLPAPA